MNNQAQRVSDEQILAIGHNKNIGFLNNSKGMLAFARAIEQAVLATSIEDDTTKQSTDQSNVSISAPDLKVSGLRDIVFDGPDDPHVRPDPITQFYTDRNRGGWKDSQPAQGVQASQIGNFGDSSAAQMQRLVDTLPLPNYAQPTQQDSTPELAAAIARMQARTPLSADAIEAFNDDSLPEISGDLSRAAQQDSTPAQGAKPTVEDYSDMLRELCCYLSVGGYNSDGLMPPEVANAKIRAGIDDHLRVQLAQQRSTPVHVTPHMKAVLVNTQETLQQVEAGIAKLAEKYDDVSVTDYGNKVAQQDSTPAPDRLEWLRKRIEGAASKVAQQDSAAMLSDTQRLAYIEANWFFKGTNDEWMFSFVEDTTFGNFPTLAEAIDDAIAASQPTGSKE